MTNFEIDQKNLKTIAYFEKPDFSFDIYKLQKEMTIILFIDILKALKYLNS